MARPAGDSAMMKPLSMVSAIESAFAAARSPRRTAPRWRGHARPGESRCSFFTPLHYEPGYGYPVVIWLHGPGADERQLQRVMPLLSMRNYVGVAPRGNIRLQPGIACDWSPASEQLGWVDDLVLDALQAAKKKYHVDSRRVFIAGFQTGGSTALQVALRYPERFAGAISMGGAFPKVQIPLSRLHEARRLPILMVKSREPVRRIDRDFRLWYAASLDVTVCEYRGALDFTSDVFRGVNGWVIGRAARTLVA